MKVDIKIVLLIVLSIILVFVIAFGCWLYFNKNAHDSGVNFGMGKSLDEVSGKFYTVGAGDSNVSDTPLTIDTDTIEEVVEEVVDSICDSDDDIECEPDDDSDDYNRSSSKVYNRSSSKVFMNKQYVIMYLVHQTFKNGTGIDIKIDGDCRIFIDGDCAGVISVLRYNSTSALLRYGGGLYGEGKIRVVIDNNKLILIDPLDGTRWYQK